MKVSLSVFFFVSLCLLSASPASAQKRKSAGRTIRASSAAGPRSICQGDPIPGGFVVVGNEAAGRCGEKHTLTVRKPAATETICDGSPLPAGYSVVDQQASIRCSGTGSNPLTNALTIKREERASGSGEESPCTSSDIKLGMNPQQVLRCEGRLPIDAHRTITEDGERFVLIFSGARYTFDDGELVRIDY
jgi:hypothetical protein